MRGRGGKVKRVRVVIILKRGKENITFRPEHIQTERYCERYGDWEKVRGLKRGKVWSMWEREAEMWERERVWEFSR